MSVLSRREGPRAELICVGTELLTGKPNAHGAYLGEKLESAGIPMARETTVSDDPKEMYPLFREAWRRSRLVITTGGLGPTFDDLTRDVWSQVLGRPLVFQPAIASRIEARFRRRGWAMPASNRRQAFILKGAQVLENREGTAPGQWITIGARTLALLPGPGRELVPMVEESLVPLLAGRFRLRRRQWRVWRIFGLPESAVDERMARLLTTRRGLQATWGILAQNFMVDVKLTVSGPGAGIYLRQAARRMKREFGNAILSDRGETLAAVVGESLRRKRKTLAVAESCTGGLLGAKITEVPGSSDYFWGGFLTYDNAAKERLGLSRAVLRRFGAVSAETAKAMALAAQRAAHTDYGLAITGIAGPEGGSAEKPVGLVFIGLAGKAARAVEKRLGGNRSTIREQAALWALEELRKELT